VLYASGEESVAQVGLRAQRLGLVAPDLTLVNENDLDQVLALALEREVALLVVDSIQTVQLGETAALAGAVTQLRECTARLVRFAKSSGTAVVIIGHVTKEAPSRGRVSSSIWWIRCCTSKARPAAAIACPFDQEPLRRGARARLLRHDDTGLKE